MFQTPQTRRDTITLSCGVNIPGQPAVCHWFCVFRVSLLVAFENCRESQAPCILSSGSTDQLASSAASCPSHSPLTISMWTFPECREIFWPLNNCTHTRIIMNNFKRLRWRLETSRLKFWHVHPHALQPWPLVLRVYRHSGQSYTVGYLAASERWGQSSLSKL